MTFELPDFITRDGGRDGVTAPRDATAAQRSKRYRDKLKKKAEAPEPEPVTVEPEPAPDLVAATPEPQQAETHPAAIHEAPRDDSGRFLRKDGAPPVEPDEATGDHPHIDVSRPPKRLPVRTKGIWQTLPEPLREDIFVLRHMVRIPGQKLMTAMTSGAPSGMRSEGRRDIDRRGPSPRWLSKMAWTRAVLHLAAELL